MLDSSIEEAGEAGSAEAEICSPERLHAISGIDTSTTSRFWLPTTGCTSEIVEEEAPEVTPPAYSDETSDVYVAVGRKNSSLDALQWALTEIAIPGTSVFLVHIFPPVTVIPTPCEFLSLRDYDRFLPGKKKKSEPLLLCKFMPYDLIIYWKRNSIIVYGILDSLHLKASNFEVNLPLEHCLLLKKLMGNINRNHVAPAQVEAFIHEEEKKREALIRKYINLCNMYEVRAETVVVESDMVAETIVQLLEIGMVKRLVMGTRRSRRRRGNGKAEYVQKNAPNDCEIRIICDGKEVVANADQTPMSPVTPSAPPPPPPPPTTTISKDGDDEDEPQDEKSNKQSEYCKCFPSLI
ncbi:hypothetical protein EJ110_NYTH32263 [Nymphaea thermarum]|nr:hypothetical protein EJ110_NYTH32263 [Nymphaea thermarum]